MEKVFVKNRKGQKIAVVVNKTPNQKGLVFVMHGLGGFKEQPHVQTFAKAFKENNYTVILFDTTNTFGESDGNYEDATTTNYYEDLEDVINWAKSQPWYEEPFCLAGHSLGGTCTALYSEKYPEKVKALAPISTVVTGKLSFETYQKEELEEWKRTGWHTSPSSSKPGVIKKLKWSHMVDRYEYDILKDVKKLEMPVLLITGENDTSTPVEHHRILFDKLQGRKEFHVIKGAPHTFKEEKHLSEIKKILDKWIKEL